MWKVEGRKLFDENGRQLAELCPTITKREEKTMEVAPQLLLSSLSLVERLKKGLLSPKTTLKEFDNILKKIFE